MVSVQYTTGEEQINSSRKNEEAGPKWKCTSIVDLSVGESKAQCGREQHCIGTWKIRSMNKGKLDGFKHDMARVNISISGISELELTGKGKFNPDDHYVYYCGKESLRRKGVALIVNQRVQNAVLGCNLKNDRMILAHFPGKPFNITLIQVYAPTINT